MAKRKGDINRFAVPCALAGKARSSSCRQRPGRPVAPLSLVLGRWGGRGGWRMRGAYLVEFVLMMFVVLALVVPLAEFLRLSLIDQALARATHRAALGVHASPVNCLDEIQSAFQDDLLAGWLLDANDDGTVAIRIPNDRATADGPLGTEEVLVVVDWDDASDGTICWADQLTPCPTGCGAFGNDHDWLQVRSRVGVVAWSGLGLWSSDFEREHRSWSSF